MAEIGPIEVNVRVNVTSAWAVQSGDRIMLGVDRDCTQEEATAITDQLHALWPDVEFVLLSGMMVVCERADTEAPATVSPRLSEQ